jgi:hypothetical protein
LRTDLRFQDLLRRMEPPLYRTARLKAFAFPHAVVYKGVL